MVDFESYFKAKRRFFPLRLPAMRQEAIVSKAITAEEARLGDAAVSPACGVVASFPGRERPMVINRILTRRRHRDRLRAGLT
jgi:hypothetical protein